MGLTCLFKSCVMETQSECPLCGKRKHYVLCDQIHKTLSTYIFHTGLNIFFFSPISSYVEADEIEKQQYCVASSIIGFLL